MGVSNDAQKNTRSKQPSIFCFHLHLLCGKSRIELISENSEREWINLRQQRWILSLYLLESLTNNVASVGNYNKRMGVDLF